MLEYFYQDFFYQYLYNHMVRLRYWQEGIYVIPLEYIGLGLFFARINTPAEFIILSLEDCRNKYDFLS